MTGEGLALAREVSSLATNNAALVKAIDRLVDKVGVIVVSVTRLEERVAVLERESKQRRESTRDSEAQAGSLWVGIASAVVGALVAAFIAGVAWLATRSTVTP